MTHNTGTRRLTVAQAVVQFLKAQYVERDGEESAFFGGAFGIFGHGNVGGLGQALLEYQDDFRFLQGRHEQGMVHMAVGYAKMRNRFGAMAVSTSIGPGASNMITGAATATVNHLPVLLLPSDTFATRATGAVLQQIEQPYSLEVTANDSFRAVSRYFDRVTRPEQLASALLEAMRVLTSPVDTGAVTIALPQDVQSEAFDFPTSLFDRRVWHVARNRADRAAIARALEAICGAERPVIIAGGGVIYSEASQALIGFADDLGAGIGVTQAGKAGVPFDHPLALGALGASGSAFANRFANNADLVIGVGTRYTDFTTASNTIFENPDVRFININVAEIDALKESGIALVGDARETLEELRAGMAGHSTAVAFRDEVTDAADGWRREVDRLIEVDDDAATLSQAVAIGLVNAAADSRDVVVNAAGSMPGDLHRLWRPGSTKGYDIEYGNSCMGYEIPGAIGATLADPERHVWCFIGDGTYLMMPQELLTAVQEKLKMTVVLVDNRGYGSIAALSNSLGGQEFGTRFFERSPDGRLAGPTLEVDFAANARSYGAEVFSASTASELRRALEAAKDFDGLSVVYAQVDSKARFGGSGAWWDVPMAEVSKVETTIAAREVYDHNKSRQRLYL